MVKYGLLYRPAVTPLPRVLRQASPLLLVAGVVALLAFSAMSAPALAQGGAGGNDTGNGTGNDTAGDGSGGDAGALPPLGAGKTSRTITIGSASGSSPICGGASECWDTEIVFAKPGERVTLIADLRDDDGTHNLHVDEQPPTESDSATIHVVTFDVPAEFDEPIHYICDIHPTTMQGEIVPYEEYQAALAGGGGHIDVPHLGVNFLAYWVGLIAFALLFIVYGITFFLFKYNETPATTDHWDRTGAGAPDARRRMGGGSAMLVAIVLAVVVLAAIIWLARR